MKEFVKKLIGRLEEAKDRANRHYNYGDETAYRHSIEIVNQLAEEYKITHMEELLKARSICANQCTSKCPFILEEKEGRCFLEELQNKLENNDWIPCSKRLPETHENVLICQSDGYVNVGLYSLNEFKDMNSIPYKDVIAWQPLPQSYQPKGE